MQKSILTRKLSFLLLILFLSAFSKAITAQEINTPQDPSNNSDNVIAPGFILESLDNRQISLADYDGKILVLHIATTWCPFCNAEAPHLEKLYQNYKDKNVEVLLIDVKEPKELVEEKLKKKYNLTFPVLLDTTGEVAASYAPKDVLPDLSRDEVMLASNLIIDEEGKIRYMSLLDSKNFDAELIELKKRLNDLL